MQVVDVALAWRAGRRREALPLVVAMAGLVVMLVFGGFALLIEVEAKILGVCVLATGLYALWLILAEVRKAGKIKR